MSAAPILDPWIAYHRPNPQARLLLFCFAYAGGGASVFRLWQEQLPPTIEVRAIQLPGRETRLRERPFTEITPLVQALARVVASEGRPCAFFGHSMGALVSFEVARHLRREGVALPHHLFVSGRRAPQVADRLAPISPLADGPFLAALRRYNGTPEAVLQNAEAMSLFLPILRADFALCERYAYRPEPPLDCPITAFGGVEDETVPPIDLAAWRLQTRATFAQHLLPGDHFFLNRYREPLLELLARDLTDLVRGLAAPVGSAPAHARPHRPQPL